MAEAFDKFEILKKAPANMQVKTMATLTVKITTDDIMVVEVAGHGLAMEAVEALREVLHEACRERAREVADG